MEITIWSTALNATDPGPINPAHPLCHMENYLILPYMGAATIESRTVIASILFQRFWHFWLHQSTGDGFVAKEGSINSIQTLFATTQLLELSRRAKVPNFLRQSTKKAAGKLIRFFK